MARTGKRSAWSGYITMNVYYLGISFMWNSIGRFLQQAIISQPNMAGRDNAEAAMGLLSFGGLLIAMIVQPVAGAFSDHFSSRWGRRRPFMFVATLTDLIFLAAIAFAPNYGFLIVAYCLLQFSSNIAHGPYQGLLADLVPEAKRGVASGVKQFIDTSGLIAAALVVPIIVADPLTALDANIKTMFAAIAFVLVGTMLVNVVLVREPALPPTPIKFPRDAFSFAAIGRFIQAVRAFIRQFPDFSWLIASRLAILGAVTFISNYIIFYFQKVIYADLKDSDQAIKAAIRSQGTLLMTVVVMLVIATLIAGPLSDHYGRRSINAVGGLIATAGATLLLFVRNVPLIVLPVASISDLFVAGILIGIGMGLYTSANWAWAIDLTPTTDAARFLGLTNIATAGATVVTSLLAPFISVLNTQTAGSGFTFLFSVSVVGLGLGTLMLFKVRETRTQG
ncbi:hypothetical protein ANRL1_04190 [Anaerolineae bacterium]|nr:hypothetical protein ANRL1_04190 [Anaerolineae bacterium]